MMCHTTHQHLSCAGNWLLLKYGKSNARCVSDTGYLFDDDSTGLADCRNKCEANSCCNFFSYWSSGKRCQTTTECNRFTTDGGKMIYTYRRKSESTLGNWKLLKPPSNKMCSRKLSSDFSYGLANCRDRCESNQRCEFFSYSITTRWCQISSDCNSWRTYSGKTVHIFRRKREGTLGN